MEDLISRQAVIDMTGLSNWFDSSDDYNSFVEDLCKLPPVAPKIHTSDDCVSRQALYESLYERFHDENTPNNITMVPLGIIRNFVKNFPPVTPTRKSRLRWIERFDNEDKWLECPHCHKDSDNAYAYCPNCGAEMRGAVNE